MMIKYYAMAGAGVVLFAAGYWIADTKADATWNEREAQYAAARVAANEAVRAQERLWQSKIEKVSKDAKATQQRLQSDSEQLAATVDSLRGTLNVSTSKLQSASATVTELRRTAATSSLVQSELSGWCIGRIEVMAGLIDRSQSAGLACQKSYNAIRFGSN